MEKNMEDDTETGEQIGEAGLHFGTVSRFVVRVGLSQET